MLLQNFAEFQHVFGGLWQPSPLGYAVEHYFDNGGREALVVRVANGARAATLTLNAGAARMTLMAVRPGTREFLRASVDYDNIPAEDPVRFNLTVQRVRAQGGSHVDDQEIFRDLSMDSASERHVRAILAHSELLRVVGELPGQRPDRTLDSSRGSAAAYVASNADGDDGAPLTDYDVIGSELELTGLFSLAAADHFNFLCIPPLSRETDVGPCAWLAAMSYCKERRALLIVDPPAAWHTADDALRAMRDWSLYSENALMYFPRVLALDKLRGHFESFAPCGAVAGMLARTDEAYPVWGPAKFEEAVLRPGYRPACMVSEDRRQRLELRGVNALQSVRSVARIGVRPRTLAGGAAAAADWQSLAARRLALFIVNSIESGTRWALNADPDSELPERVAAQVRGFFEELHAGGAFGARRPEEAFFVRVAQGARAAQVEHSNEFQLRFGFAATRTQEFHCFRVLYSASGIAVRFVTQGHPRLDRLNPAEYCPEELAWVNRLARQLEPPQSLQAV